MYGINHAYGGWERGGTRESGRREDENAGINCHIIASAKVGVGVACHAAQCHRVFCMRNEDVRLKNDKIKWVANILD